jgi:hypothetical protein
MKRGRLFVSNGKKWEEAVRNYFKGLYRQVNRKKNQP